MKISRFLTILLAISSLSVMGVGCSSDESGQDDSGNQVMPSSPETDRSLSARDEDLKASDVPDVSEADMKKYGDKMNEFASGMDFMLHDDAVSGGKSYVFSPFSIHSAMSMTSYGAVGDTYKEMASALKLDEDKDVASKLNGEVYTKLRYDGQNEKSRFRIANRIWVDRSAEIVPAFSDAMDKYYKAPLKVVDFVKDAQMITGIINLWVSNNTDNRIQNLIQDGLLGADTRMVLVNAISFDGEWAEKFKPERSYDGKFKLLSGDESDVRMMGLDSGQFMYYRSEDYHYQTASMDYEGGEFAMMIILPDDINGFDEMSMKLTHEEFRKILDGQAMHDGTVVMPKFKIETEIDSDKTIAMMKSLGIKKAFAPDTADFSGMIVPDVLNSHLYISDVIHKAIFEVDEEGTKAAAATAVVISKVGAMLPPDDFIYFIADHPFEFVLYHKASGAMLFAGQYLGN